MSKTIDMISEVVIKNEDGSEKKVKLRQALIKDINMASSIAATKCEDPKILPLYMQQELMKSLIVDVDGKVPSSLQREDLDGMFTIAEYAALMGYVEKVMGKSQVARQSFLKTSGDK